MPATMNGTRGARASRSRTGTPDRGGIRKRGAPQRIDRDGDLDMDASGAGRGGRGRGRGDASRRPQTVRPRESRRPADGDGKTKTLDALHKAIFSNASSQINIRQGRSPATDGPAKDRKGLVPLSVSGWKNSKAASNADGGVENLIAFLERKSTPPDPNNAAHLRLKITKSRVEGNALIVYVRPEQVSWVLRINGYSFAGSPLTISEHHGPASDRTGENTSQSTIDTKTKMTNILGKRYFAEPKILDLSRLGADPDLVEMGMFDSTSTQSKFFPALMKICELNFDSPQKRRDAVVGVSLAHNQLPNVSTVTTLSQTFPELKNLDLSNNQIKDTQGLSAWRWKFRDLDFLDLSNNPVSAQPDFKETMLKWYPKLRTLNNTPVRTTEEIEAVSKKTPIPVMGPSFRDESQIAETFVKAFFVGFDNDRSDLLSSVYDASSTFSFNINTNAPRASQSDSAAGWEPYIRKSRNLTKIQHLPAQMSRSFVGLESIREVWNSLPKTKHPDMATNPKEWLIECHPIPGLPDPSGQSATGVGGLLITTHGKFDELDISHGNRVQTRSFDRTFVLGPGGGYGGIRVVNDMLCLRAYGGSEAWVPESDQAAPPPTVPNAIQAPTLTTTPAARAHPEAKDGYGMPAPGKTEDQLKKEQVVLQMSFQTNMTLQFSEMALSGNNWDINAALKNFEELKAQGKLPANAFLTAA